MVNINNRIGAQQDFNQRYNPKLQPITHNCCLKVWPLRSHLADKLELVIVDNAVLIPQPATEHVRVTVSATGKAADTVLLW